MFSRSVKFLTLFGIPIRLDPSWVLIAALVVWSLATGYFPLIVPGISSFGYLTLATIAMLVLFASLIIHELAHAITSRQFGLEIEAITLFLFGGVAEMKAEPNSAKSELYVAAAGPLASFVLAFGFWTAERIFLAVEMPLTSAVLGYLALINLVLAVFNLLPAFPLDGGRIFRAILWSRTGDVLDATRRACRLGSVLAYALMALGLFNLFSGAVIGGLWPIVIGLYLLMTTQSAYQQLWAKTRLRGYKVENLMSAPAHFTSPNTNLSELVSTVLLGHATKFLPVVEDDHLIGYIDSQVVLGIDREYWVATKVGDVFEKMDPSNTIDPDLPVDELLDRINQSGRRKFMVADGDTLLGVITLSDLVGFLGILNEFDPTRHNQASSFSSITAN